MNETNEDLQTDDEALRLAGMTDGPKAVGKFTVKPMTAETLAWSQSVGIYDDGIGTIHRTAAYVMLHTLAKSELLPLIFNRLKFWTRVSEWVGENVQHHEELTPYAAEMSAAWERYSAAISKPAHPSNSKGPDAKN